MAFAEMAKRISREWDDVRFVVVGPDEGDLGKLRKFIDDNRLGDRLYYEGALGPGLGQERLRSSAVLVLPSFGEVFPMTVLESMAAGTPVVLTRDCGIAEELAARQAAVVTDGSPIELAAAVRRLLTDRVFWKSVQTNADRAMAELYEIASVATKLETLYEQAAMNSCK
jgi:glycosyltransferase involved in cell wall biosynthesis